MLWYLNVLNYYPAMLQIGYQCGCKNYRRIISRLVATQKHLWLRTISCRPWEGSVSTLDCTFCDHRPYRIWLVYFTRSSTVGRFLTICSVDANVGHNVVINIVTNILSGSLWPCHVVLGRQGQGSLTYEFKRVLCVSPKRRAGGRD